MNAVPPLGALTDDKTAPFVAALFVTTENMAPTIRRGSLVFLGPRGTYVGDGLYCFPDPRTDRPMQVYRSQTSPGANRAQIKIKMDDWPVPWQEMTFTRWRELNPWPVAGVATSHMAAFEDFLRERFMEVQS